MSGFSRSHGLQFVVTHIFIQYQISLVGRAVRALGAFQDRHWTWTLARRPTSR